MGKSSKLGQVPNAPVFSAYRTSSNQSLTSAAWTKIQCNGEDVDTASAYDNATNYRFQPAVAGYYQVNGQVYYTGTGLTNLAVQIYKNGTGHRNGTGVVQTAGTDGSVGVSALVYLNGSTDYIELFGLVVGTSPVAVVGVNLTYFQGALVRPA